jgi:hypothetical protein
LPREGPLEIHKYGDRFRTLYAADSLFHFEIEVAVYVLNFYLWFSRLLFGSYLCVMDCSTTAFYLMACILFLSIFSITKCKKIVYIISSATAFITRVKGRWRVLTVERFTCIFNSITSACIQGKVDCDK